MPPSLIGANVMKEPAGTFGVGVSSAVKDAAIFSKMLVPIYRINAYIW
jgi:hypothetical protein